MPINEDISDLPRARSRQARHPSSHPIIVNVVAESWYQDYLDRGMDEYAPVLPLPFRMSLAGDRCDRQLYYDMAGVEPTDPNTIADAWRFEIGHFVGDGVARHLGALGEGWFPEWNVDLRPIDIEGSGHIDVVKMICTTCEVGMRLASVINITTTDDPRAHHVDLEHGGVVDEIGNPLLVCPRCEGVEYRAEYVVEVKSINGFGWKKSATNFKGTAEGPKSGHLIQGALGAWVLGCDKIIIAYFGVENLSPDLAKQFTNDELGRFAGEWHYSLQQLMPLLEQERERINRIQRFLDPAVDLVPVRELCDPEYPAGATVVNPMARGHWIVYNDDGSAAQTGTTWMCGYCKHRRRCVEEGESAAEDQSDAI